MKKPIAMVLLSYFAATIAGQQVQAHPANTDVMITAVSRDESVLTGGITGRSLKRSGTVYVVPLAWITDTGQWKSIACDADHPGDCLRFTSDYLAKSHLYTVVSSNGQGAAVKVRKMALDECYAYGGDGLYSGHSIPSTAIAASSQRIFAEAPPVRRLSTQDAIPILRAFAISAASKLDSTKELRVYSLKLNGYSLFVVERAFQNWASNLEYQPGKTGSGDKELDLKMILAIGDMRNGRFELLHWKEDIEIDNEQILGSIHLKNGSEFLIDSVNDPEGVSFRVYGIRNGRVAIIYSGGGGSC